MEESISLEETNRHRISLGLKPIPIPGAPVKSQSVPEASGEVSEDARNRLRQSLGLAQETKSRDQVEYENWQEKQKEATESHRQSEIEARLAAAAERRAKRKRLAGSGLGEDGDDTISFLKNINKKRPKIAIQLEDDVDEYTSKDLGGMKVGHSLEEFQNGGGEEGIILTLKDTDVLDEDGEDVLESAQLNESSKQRASDQIRKGVQRTAYDDSGKLGEEPKEDFFVLGEGGVIKGASGEAEAIKKTKAKEKERTKVSFSFLNDEEEDEIPTSDYKRVKKSKSKGKKSREGSRRVKLESEEPEDDKRHLTNNVSTKLSQQEVDDMLRDDDEEFRLSMRKNLIKSQKNRKKLTPEELAEQLAADRDEDMGVKEEEEDGGLVLNETTDFLTTLRKAQEAKEEEEEEGVMVEEVEVKPEITEPTVDATVKKEEEDIETPQGVDDPLNEEDIGTGAGDVLKMLRSRGIIKNVSKEEREKQKALREQREWRKREERENLLREIRLREEREQLEEEGVYEGLTRQEREEIEAEEERIRLQEESEAAQKRFENYEPEINLQYYDDMGQKLDSKAAYKYLSHQFHGKGPGKGSVERSLKKAEEARNQERLAHERTQASSNSNRTSAGTRIG
ncbi:U4/U6.U5 tri-snRNP-associated protein [Yarrowia sp. C11]|nr:U4/U6.U5 tri-snRNP-associated protein [Yarrowia sp. E02]KAG5372962.1 U4/U6.U5 tri-snRNP-associated protein [Yarrowia sp. C11]